MDTTASATPAGSLTRAQVAKLLGISVAGVRRREGTSLHPQRGPKGEHLFDASAVEAERQRMLAEGRREPTPAQTESAPAGVERAPMDEAAGASSVKPGEATPSPGAEVTPPLAKADGAVAAQMFALFGQGKAPVEVVIETKLAPAVIEALYESWLHLKSKDVTSDAARSRINAVAMDVMSLKAQVENLADSADALRRAIEVHDQNVPAFDSELSGVADRVDAIEQHVADPTLRNMAESTNDMVGNLICRVTNFERTFQTWVPHMQAICQRMRG